MFIDDSLWKNILVLFSLIYLVTASGSQRENLARRHPCNVINKRLEPFIKWTERLASTQYKVQRDACGQSRHGPACCTNEIFNSYVISLGTDLKISLDAQLNHLTHVFSIYKKGITTWTNEYVMESRQRTMLSLEKLFGSEEFNSNIHRSVSTLFEILGDHHSTPDDVSKSANNVFDQLIISTYRRFMTHNSDLTIDNHFQQCLLTKAFDIEALPARREILYTLTSAASLIHILRTLFVYIDADIHQLKTTITLDSLPCFQRYVRETLCPICLSESSPQFSSSMNYDNNIDEPLCESDCRYVMKTCFDQMNNPYIAFTLVAQGYSNIVKHIEKSVVELKLVERLSKLHIYLYDMVVNVTNTQRTYIQLQNACPNSNIKPYKPILSISPITNERRELVTKSNESLHAMLHELQTLINNLNVTLVEKGTNHICTNSNYAVKSNSCTQIDQHTPGDMSQWPLPTTESTAQITSSLTSELTRNQLDDLTKKMNLVQEMIVSLRPEKKTPLMEYVPDFDYENEPSTNLNDVDSEPSQSVESHENHDHDSFSEQLYRVLDNRSTRETTTTTDMSTTTTKNSTIQTTPNHSKNITYNTLFYLSFFTLLIIHRISFVY